MRPKTQFEFWLGVVVCWLSMTSILSAQDNLNIPLKTIMISPDLSVVLEIDNEGFSGTVYYETYYTAEGYQEDPYLNSNVKWRLVETGTYTPSAAPAFLPVNDASNLLDSPTDSHPTVSCFYVLAASAWDTDSDQQPDIINDQDGDGLSDAYELLITKTSPFFKDNDSNSIDDNLEDFDFDGLTNEQEYALKTDPYDDDTDGDGLSDAIESNTGLYSNNSDTGTNPIDYDTDRDGLNDNTEVIDIQFDGFESGNFSAMDWSHSGDISWEVSMDAPYAGLYDARVPASLDHDQSSVLELHFAITSEQVFSFFYKCSTQEDADTFLIIINDEIQQSVSGEINWTQFVKVLQRGTYHIRLIYQKDDALDSGEDTIWIDNVSLLSGTDPNIADMDEDGLLDGEEKTVGTSPHQADTDSDGVSDYDEIKLYHSNPLLDDTDLDGLDDAYEINFGSDPNNPDTDGDQIPDGWEQNNSLDPNTPDSMNDSDGDGRLTNYEEYILDTNPWNANDPVVIYVDPTGDQTYGSGTLGNPFGSILQAIENYGSYNSAAAIFVLNNDGTAKEYDINNDTYVANASLNSIFIDQDFYYYLFYGSSGTSDVFRFAIYGSSPDKVTIKSKHGYPAFKFWYGDSDYYGDPGYWDSVLGDYATSRILIKNVTVVESTSAFECHYSSPVMVNCIMKNNQGVNGAGVYAEYSNPEIINCLITDNTALRGSGVYITGTSEAAIVNSTISGNSGQEGVGIFIDGTSADPIIINSIIWEESGDDIANVASSMISYCDIEDGDYEGTNGNISLDPKFGSPQFGNFHILYNSPCRGAGDPIGLFSPDIHNEIRPADSTCDMGYDEFLDSNANNLPDFWETQYGGGPYTASADGDSDGATNAQEAAYLSNPGSANSDTDSANDGLEINTYHTNPLTNTDTDGDTLLDVAEASGNGVSKVTDPYNADTDGDGINDYNELAYNLDPSNAADASADGDGDGITNYEEIFLGSDPTDYYSPQRIYVNQATGVYSYDGGDWPEGTEYSPYASLQEAMDEVPLYFGGYSAPVAFIMADGTYDIYSDNYLYDFQLNSVMADQVWFKNSSGFNDVYRCIIMGSSPDNVEIIALETDPAFKALYGSDPACGDPPVILKNITFTGGTCGIEVIFSKNVLISNCISTDNSGTYGVGIYGELSTINLLNTVVSDNVASDAGSGIYLVKSNMTMIGGSISENNVVYSTGSSAIGQGGGLYASGSSPLTHSLTLRGVRVENNITFAQGAGLYAEFVNLELDNDTFTGNQVDVQNSGSTRGDGAGMYLKSLKCAITDTVITENVSEKSGGGIYTKDGRYYENENDTYGTYIPMLCEIDSSEITDNIATNTGGGLFSQNSYTVVENSLFSGNETYSSFGAGAAADSSTFIMDSCDVVANIAGTAGAGIHTNDTDLNIKNTTINSNSSYSSAGYGGGLLIKGTEPATVKDSIISENYALTGGGVYLDTSSPLLQNVTIDSNTAYRAAGIYLMNSDPTISESIIKNNVAESEGGGIMAYSSIGTNGYPTRASDLNLIKSIVKNNEANKGAGIVLESFTICDILYSVIDGNSSVTRTAGGIWTKSSQYGYPLNIKNCVIVNNTEDIFGVFEQNESPTIRYCCIETSGYPTNAGNISVEPAFVSPVNDNYHLRATSPLIDMGTAYASSGTDIDSETRPYTANTLLDNPSYTARPLDNASDIGIDEFIDTDNDGMPNYWETMYLVDFDNDADWDNDGVTNLDEYNYYSDPTKSDSDNDGIPDYAEIFVYDTNPHKDDDTDGDGLLDREEIYDLTYGLTGYGTDPANPDTDQDGMDDKYEIDNNLNPNLVDALLDSDSDNLSNYEEFLVQTDPNSSSEPVTVNASSYGSIQAAIDAATGPTIIMLDSDTTYLETITLKDDIFIIATDPLSTKITSNGIGPVFTASNASRCLLKNITIDKGVYGIYASGSSINIINCHIKNNLDSGIYITSASNESRIIDCKIYNNKAIYGGGIYCGDVPLTIVNTDIYNNKAQVGGGINVALTSAEKSFLIANSNIVNNTAASGGGIARTGTRVINIENCNIADNSTEFKGISSSEVFNSNIGDGSFLGINNNISETPDFGAPQFGRFNLSGSSPCIDTGTSKVYFAVDPDSEMRNSGSAIDIGSDEFVDTDEDYLADAWELKYAANLTILDNDADDDSDTILNSIEYAYYTDPTSDDTDTDGLTDAQEINGITYQSQLIYTDPIAYDTDEDGISDGDEINQHGTNPLLQDTDDDGLSDSWEIQYSLDPLAYNPDGDLDCDGLSNIEEFELGTIPNDNTSPTQVYVDITGAYSGSYTSINAALQAESGPVIINILPGTYEESVVLDASNEKTALIGTSPDAVIIDTIATESALSCTNITYVIIKNISLRGSMHGLYSQNAFSRLVNCYISNNASNENGGGIQCTYGSIDLIDCTIANNTTKNKGAGLYGYYTQLSMTNTIVKQNTITHSTSSNGAGIYLFGTEAVITASTIQENYSTRKGGGLFADDGSDVIIRNSIISSNFSITGGGGIYATETIQLLLDGCYIQDNISQSNGGGLCLSSADSVIYHTTFANNRANSTGDGIYAYPGSAVTLKNSILWNYNDDFDGIQSTQVEYCNIKDASFEGSNGNISSDPLFVNAQNGDYHIRPGSPCIDAAITISGAGTLDSDTETRGDNGLPDIGADEVVDTDLDTIADFWELLYAVDLTVLDNDGADSDSDTLTDVQEYLLGSNPTSTDTDGDTLNDADEVNNYQTDATSADTDGDGLSDANEISSFSTDPLNIDTDGDFIDDNYEASTTGLSPTDSTDAQLDPDSDNLTNLEEYYLGSDINLSTSPATVNVTTSNNLQTVIDSATVPTKFVLAAGTYSVEEASVYQSISLKSGTALYADPASAVIITTYGSNPILAADNISGVVIKNITLSNGTTALSANQTENILLSNCIVEDNSSGNGAIDISLSKTMLYNSNIRNNTICGIYATNSSINVIDSFITDNVTKTNLAGGIAVCYYRPLNPFEKNIIQGCTINSNTLAQGNGGAVAVLAAPLEIIDTTITENKALNGAGIYAYNAQLTVTQCIINENTAYQAGGAIYLQRCNDVFIDHIILLDNISYKSTGDGISINSYSEGSITNSILSNYFDDINEISSAIVIKNNVIMDGTYAGVDGNIDDDPQFIDAAHGNYHLKNTSTLINAGTTDSLLYHDIDGESTIDGSASDIGIDEFVDTDTDNLADAWELLYGANLAAISDAGQDTDSDTLLNGDEYNAYSDPSISDTDADTLSDADEVNLHASSPTLADTDGDGLDDDLEITNSCDPNATDTDQDLIDDAYEVSKAFLSPTDSSDASLDQDTDGLTNYEEYYLGSDPDNYNSPTRITVSSTIQAAINQSSTPKIILISNGSFNEDLSIEDQQGVVLWAQDPELTTLSAAYGYPCIAITGSQKVILKNLTLSDASSSGITLENSSLMISNCIMDSNVSYSNGGAVEASSSSIICFDSTFSNNLVNYLGGAFYLDMCDLSVYNCEFIKNQYYDVYALYSSVLIEDSTLYNQYSFNGFSYTYYRQALYAKSSQITIKNSTIHDVMSSAKGAAVYVYESKLDASNITIYGANAKENGGAIYLCNALADVFNSVFFNNNSDKNGACFMIDSGARLNLYHSILYNNDATYGGGIYNLSSASSKVINCVVWGNHDDLYNVSATILANSNISDGDHVGVNGNISEEPKFRNADKHDFHLLFDSPCRDAGILITGNSLFDIDEEQRPDDTLVDIGIDEFCDSDNDGLPNFWETLMGGDIAPDSDTDTDNLTAIEEYSYLTNPTLTDTDSDGLTDEQEIKTYGTDPILDADKDKDGLTDAEEVITYSTNPSSADSDDDLMPDKWEVDYGLNPLIASDALNDGDSDTLTNREEYFITSEPDNAASPQLVYVDINAAEGGDGSQSSPYQSIRTAVNNNSLLYAPLLIIVAPGTYKENMYMYNRISVRGDSPENTFVESTLDSASTFYYPECDKAGLLLKNMTIRKGYHALEASDTDLLIVNCVITSNAGSPTYGGGIQLNKSNSVIIDSIIENNTCTINGGGIYTNNSNLQCINSTIKNNTATVQGGGAYISNAEKAIFANCQVESNTAQTGGGLQFYKSSSTVLNSQIKQNTATSEGAGLYCYSGTNSIYNTIINQNMSTSRGGGIYGVYCESNIENSVLVSNSAGTTGQNEGNGIYNYNATISVKNSILWNNGDELGGFDGSTIFNCDIKDGSYNGTNGNISVDPKFVNVALNDFHLFSDSLCIDAGTADTNVPNDVDAESRPANGLVDIGIDEMIDTDIDGLPNYWETKYGQDFVPTADDDSDTLTNDQEYVYQTNPLLSDTDSDGLRDDAELFTHLTDPNDDDTDDDGLNDGDELLVYFTDPFISDSDNDGMTDGWEAQYTLNPMLNDAYDNMDSDQLTNLEEFLLGSIPNDNTSPAQIYVDDDASAGGDGSQGSPFTTIQDAIDTIDEDSTAVVVIAAGTYSENLDLTGAGTVAIAGVSSDTVTLSALPYSYAITCADREDILIVKNLSIESGKGGIYTTNAPLMVTNSVITRNYGSGIIIDENKQMVKLINCTISHNKATSGAGIWCYASSPEIYNCVISYNEASEGAGIWASSGYSDKALAPKIYHSIIINNTATTAGGIYVGIYDLALRVYNSVIWANGDDLYGGTNDMLHYCTIEDGDFTFGGDNNISKNPQFGAAQFGKYHLLSTSELIDAGSSNVELSLDKDGETRPYNTNCDIGIDEYIDLDNDGLADHWESLYSGDYDPAADDDNDTVINSIEVQYYSNPQAIDSDGDNLTDAEEITPYGTDPTAVDTDDDGLSDFLEISYNSNALVRDTDGDGMLDGWEFVYGLDMLSAVDKDADNDNDSLSNYEEHSLGSEPNNVASPQFVYIDSTADNDGDGSQALPFNTISDAIEETQPPYLFHLSGSFTETMNFEDAFILLGDGATITGNLTTQPVLAIDGVGMGIIKNITFIGGKGGISVNSSTIQISGCTIKNTTLNATKGGGVGVFGSEVTITDTEISNCSASLYGGGLFAGGNDYSSSSSVKLENVLIKANTSAYDGGGLMADSKSVIVVLNSKIQDNTANHYGGAIGLKNNANVKLINSVVAVNHANYSGGGVFSHGSKPEILNSVLYKNTRTSGQGSSLYFVSSNTGFVRNSIIWSDDTYDEQDDLSGVAEGIITYSDVEDSIAETFNNMSLDPEFVDPDTYNFHLLPSSQVIDKGTEEAEYSKDVDGQTRPRGIAVDMGIDEYYPQQ